MYNQPTILFLYKEIFPFSNIYLANYRYFAAKCKNKICVENFSYVYELILSNLLSLATFLPGILSTAI